MTAVIDVNLHAGAALQTGWMLAGSAGSYCQQRIFLTDPSGEVCDTPIAATDVPPLDIYADLTQTTRGSSATRLESAAEALTVLQIIDAAQSLGSNRPGCRVERLTRRGVGKPEGEETAILP